MGNDEHGNANPSSFWLEWLKAQRSRQTASPPLHVQESQLHEAENRIIDQIMTLFEQSLTSSTIDELRTIYDDTLAKLGPSESQALEGRPAIIDHTSATRYDPAVLGAAQHLERDELVERILKAARTIAVGERGDAKGAGTDAGRGR